MKVSGGCHCGRVAYEAQIDATKVWLCYCTDCQTLSGSAFRTAVRCAEEDFHLVSGTPKIYVKLSDSGARRVQAFCGDCGSPIYATSEGPGPRQFGLRVGTIHQRAELIPRKQYWCRSANDWALELGSIPRIETQ